MSRRSEISSTKPSRNSKLPSLSLTTCASQRMVKHLPSLCFQSTSTPCTESCRWHQAVASSRSSGGRYTSVAMRRPRTSSSDSYPSIFTSAGLAYPHRLTPHDAVTPSPLRLVLEWLVAIVRRNDRRDRHPDYFAS